MGVFKQLESHGRLTLQGLLLELDGEELAVMFRVQIEGLKDEHIAIKGSSVGQIPTAATVFSPSSR